MKKFRNKYRIPSARLPGWDYRHAGAYFITICTQNRTPFFGECPGGKMKLSTAGMIAQGCWYQIPFLNPHVKLGAFVVMPNHVHGIMTLDEMGNDGDGCGVGNNDDDGGVETFDSNVSTTPADTIPQTHTKSANHYPSNNSQNDHPTKSSSKNPFYQKISPKSGSVSRIIQRSCPKIG